MLDRTYGYEVKNGRYQICRMEAGIVRQIFADVIDGKGVHRIAADLNERNILTRREGGKWYHGMITKMIKNPRYSGERGYPGIVKKSVQNEAITALERKSLYRIRTNSNRRNKQSPLNGMIKCQNCGSGFCLYEVNEIRFWRCTSYDGKSGCNLYRRWDGYADTEVQRITLEVINDLIKMPEVITNTGIKQHNHLEIIKIENKIQTAVKNKSANAQEIMKLIQQKHKLLYAQYNKDYISETILLREYLRKLNAQLRLEKEAVISIFKEIQIDGNGNIIYELINHQIIEKKLPILRGIHHG